MKRVNRRIGKRPTMDYDDVAGFVETMMQRWKPVYKKCDCVIDTTYGRTENLIDSIHETLAREGVEFEKTTSYGGRAT